MIRKGIAVCVILLTIGVAFTSSINANVSKSSLEPVTDIDVIEDDATPIALVLQLINKLRNHKDIENVETEEEVLQFIEGDAELNSIYEELFVEDCGCDDSTPFEWPFPIICVLLLPFLFIGLSWWAMGGVEFFLVMVGRIGHVFNCWWA